MRALRLCLSTFVAALLLMLGVAAAHARRFELSNQHIRVVWNVNESQDLAFGVTEIGVECPVTFEGSFHSRTISKVSGQLIGYITRAALTKAGCAFDPAVENIILLNGIEALPEGGAAPNTLPWHIRYDSFTGSLPRISSIRIQIIGLSVRLEVASEPCLYRSTAAGPAYGVILVEAAGKITGLNAAEGSATIPKLSGPVICPSPIGWAGTGHVFVLGTTTSITVRLVQ